MTVAELIEELGKYPGDEEVVTVDGHGEFEAATAYRNDEGKIEIGPAYLWSLAAVAGPAMRWTGPRDEDWENQIQTRLKAPVPSERWPYGPADEHEDFCHLHDGGLYCDCQASSE